jgi:hypothetical protein
LEYMAVTFVDECFREKTDEFFARGAVHGTGSRVGFYHASRFQVDDDKSIGDRIKNALKLPFVFCRRWEVRSFGQGVYLLLISMACSRSISAKTSSGLVSISRSASSLS